VGRVTVKIKTEAKQKHDRLIVMRERFGFEVQKDFSAFLGISQSQYNRMETGEITPHYKDICARTGVSADFLLGLTDDMWGNTVKALRLEIVAKLVALPESERAKLTALTTVAGQRLDKVLKIAQVIAPGFVTDDYILALLKLEQPDLNEIRSGKVYAEDHICKRVADWLRIPVEWFDHGDVSVLSEERFEEYQVVVARLMSKGVTPEKLEHLLAILP
jgi:transcriptional regulator with XRE-family HTH domain